MQRLVIIGYGDIAARAVPYLRGRYRIYALVRNPERSAGLRCQGVIPVAGDLDRPESLGRLAGLAHCILHFAPPQSHGVCDQRTRHLLAALNRRPSLPQRLIYISTSGVYGDCAGAPAAETRPICPVTPRAARRADAEAELRKWGRRRGVAVSILRVPGIYAANRLPLARLQAGTPALRPEDDAYTNHIHADDLARIAVAALRRGRNGRIYNAADDSALKMGDWFDLVADHFGLARPERIDREEARRRIAPELLSFMNESRRLTNTRIKDELRVRLVWPTVQEGVKSGT
ncbi:MAG: NAD-dependent epimerase/dehydratase family protein [Pseudomonadota bacterium]